MKKLIPLVFVALLCNGLFAASMNFSGSFRGEGNYFSNLNLGLPASSTKTYLGGRAILTPNLVIDDHLSVYSRWNMLTSPNFTTAGITQPGQQSPTTLPYPTFLASGTGLSTGQGGFVFGDPNTQMLNLQQLWLEWTSDFGVFRLGRMPVSWGYGLLWDAGNNPWDDFLTTLDRVEYRLHLGHVIGALAFSKNRKLSTLGTENDADFYTVYLKYENPELDVEAGILYEKQNRSNNQQAELLQQGPAIGLYPLPGAALNTVTSPYPLSNNVLDAYFKKTVGYFTFGGEVGWLSGNAVSYTNSGTPDNMSAFGFTTNATYTNHKIKLFLDFLYASGDAALAGGHNNAFVLLNRNRRAGIIFRELLGPLYNGQNAGSGSWTTYSSTGVYSGVYYFRPGFSVDWSQSWSSGIEFILAWKAATGPAEDASLGLEVDLGTDYAIYKNFNINVGLGYLFPGLGLLSRSSVSGINPTGALGFRATTALKF